MKSFLIYLLFPLFFLQISSFTEKTRVILLGIDGLHALTFQSLSKPNLDPWISNSSYTFQARGSFEAWSSSGWSSLLCSLDSSFTGIRDNSWKPEGSDAGLFCLFQAIKARDRTKKTGFYYSWDWLEYFGGQGELVDEEFSCGNPNEDNYVECDLKIQEMFLDRLEKVQDGNPFDFDFFFLYLGAVDFVGHNKTFGGTEYRDMVLEKDKYIGRD